MMPTETTDALASILDGAVPSDLESPTLDFKEVGRSVPDTLRNLAEAAVCFANASGGTLVVGVRDKARGAAAFVGSPLDPVRTVSRIYELSDPGLIVTAENHQAGGVTLTVLTVPPSPDVHQVAGKATERIGKSCRTMSSSRITAVLADRRGDDWSDKVSGHDIQDISASAVEHARELLAKASDPERAGWAGLPWPDLARRLGVVREDRLTNAGVLLFAASEQVHGRYIRKAANAGLLSANEELRGPGILAIRRAFDLIESRTEGTAILLPSGQQLLITDLPSAATREAVVNAFIHRDYRTTGEILIEHAASRLRVTSPGGFVPGVTPANVLTVSSRCRNLCLAQAVRALGLAESAGVGVDRMYVSMTAVGHQPPDFTTDGVTVSAILRGGPPNEPVVRFVVSLPDERRSDPDTLLVLMHLLTHRTVSAATVRAILQRSDSETEEILLNLSAPGQAIIERTAETATTHRGEYRLVGEVLKQLGPAVRYRSRSGGDTERKVVAVVRETGSVNGRLVQAMLDVRPATASRILADLVARGVLVRTSAATRGRGVKYGAGPDFPAVRKSRSATRKGNAT